MKKFFKYTGITLVSFVSVLYILFLTVPFFLNGILNSHSEDIIKLVEETSGFKLKLENMQILTTPKLTVGAGAGHIEAALPTGEVFV